MDIVVLCIQADSPPWLKELQLNYQKKITAFAPFEIKILKPKKHGREQLEFKKNFESKMLLAELHDHDLIVLLDEKGKDLDSIEFSRRIERWQMSGKKRLVFLIGGAYGVSDEVKGRAQETIRLSKMTMNHHMAQAVLLEQTYRAFSIIKGLPYHNA